MAAETVSCTLVITRHAHAEILFIKKEPDVFELPKFSIPRWERIAPHLASQVKAHLLVDAICLFSGEDGRPEYGTSRFCVLETWNAVGQQADGLAWMSIDGADWEGALSEANRRTLQTAISRAKAYDRGASTGPFARSGWFNQLRSWIEGQLPKQGLELGTGWTQFNMGPEFCLLRLETNRAALWFKAVGEPNLKEYAINTQLARLRSPHVPETIATHSIWHGWLMREAHGCHLDETSAPRSWEIVAQSLANLQIASIGICDDLLTAGCKDLRLQHLTNLIEPLLNVIHELMAAQTVHTPRALRPKELSELNGHLRLACECLQAAEIPNTLGQIDLNPGNVLVTDDGAVFLDWAEASIGPPFFTLEYLIALCERLQPNDAAAGNSIRDAYLVLWRVGYSEELLRRMFRWTPLLAMLAFAAGSSGWQAGTEHIHPNVQKLLRSLARRMYKATQTLA